MSFNLVLQSEAVIDIQEAFEWYEAQKPGLWLEFIAEIGEGFEKICNYPLYYSAINNRFRRAEKINTPIEAGIGIKPIPNDLQSSQPSRLNRPK